MKRDGECCVLCRLKTGQRNGYKLQCAHYISRGQGGMGIEQNLVMLCPNCHRRTDQTNERDGNLNMIAGYLRTKYPGWDDIAKTYNKWSELETC